MYTSSISIDQTIEALGAFIQPFTSGAQIVRAQVNRVSMPPNPCVVLTELLEVDIDQPYVKYPTDTQTANIQGSKRVDVQIDFYGALAGDYCSAFKAAFRSSYAYDVFPSNIKPLYCEDGIQSPLITGEDQYESRWVITAHLQYNPVIVVPQQSAIVLEINIFEDLQ